MPKAAGETNPVKGKVLLAGGRPLAGGSVGFVPVKEPGVEAHGTTDSEGNFELTTWKQGDGALAGEYKIRIGPPAPPGGANKPVRPPFPVEYTGEDSSGLTETVKPGPNVFEIKLQASHPKAASSRRRD